MVRLGECGFAVVSEKKYVRWVGDVTTRAGDVTNGIFPLTTANPDSPRRTMPLSTGNYTRAIDMSIDKNSPSSWLVLLVVRKCGQQLDLGLV